jgi:hypothetical protein
MKNRIKKIVVDNEAFAWYVLGAAIGITGYTIGCRAYGYRMVKPLHAKGDYFFVETLSGIVLKAKLDPETK